MLCCFLQSNYELCLLRFIIASVSGAILIMDNTKGNLFNKGDGIKVHKLLKYVTTAFKMGYMTSDKQFPNRKCQYKFQT